MTTTHRKTWTEGVGLLWEPKEVGFGLNDYRFSLLVRLVGVSLTKRETDTGFHRFQ